MDPTCWISQWSTDGLGHQLFGMLTLMALDNASIGGQRVRYDACTERERHFEHLGRQAIAERVQAYVRTSMKRFCQSRDPEAQSKKRALFVAIPRQETNRGWDSLPCNNDTVYGIDTGLYDGLVSRLTASRLRLQRTFLPGLGRPPPRFSSSLLNQSATPSRDVRHAVIHVRMGDSKMRGKNPEARQLLRAVVHRLQQRARRQRVDLEMWLHTDERNDAALREMANRENVHICDGTSCGGSVLDALRDMAHADWLITADSAFSRLAAWINARASLIVAPRTYCSPLFSTKNHTCVPAGTLTYSELLRGADADRACERLRMYLKLGTAFVHIPKNAGTSVELATLGILPCSNTSAAKQPCGSEHATAATLRACSPHRFDVTETFAILRHPIARALSMYRYTRDGGNGGAEDKLKFAWASQLSGFDDFVDEIHTRLNAEECLANEPCLFAPQATFVQDVEGRLLVKTLLCAEDLKHGWAMLQSRVPTLINQTLPASPMRASTLNDRTLVSKRAQRTLSRIYATDLELWKQYCGDHRSER